MMIYLRAFWFVIATVCCALFLALAVQNLWQDIAYKPWRPLW